MIAPLSGSIRIRMDVLVGQRSIGNAPAARRVTLEAHDAFDGADQDVLDGAEER